MLVLADVTDKSVGRLCVFYVEGLKIGGLFSWFVPIIIRLKLVIFD